MHADHPQEEDGIIVIALDPFTFASWTLHAVHSNRLRELIVRDILAVPCAANIEDYFLNPTPGPSNAIAGQDH